MTGTSPVTTILCVSPLARLLRGGVARLCVVVTGLVIAHRRLFWRFRAWSRVPFSRVWDGDW